MRLANVRRSGNAIDMADHIAELVALVILELLDQRPALDAIQKGRADSDTDAANIRIAVDVQRGEKLSDGPRGNRFSLEVRIHGATATVDQMDDIESEIEAALNEPPAEPLTAIAAFEYFEIENRNEDVDEANTDKVRNRVIAVTVRAKAS